ncbi:hypothetical protein NM688_g924 [Phlebia brevispora]|uniref:Uncharacterized protein n=1 Tax=Phlebia brevispora TaxID=194682 RepID=A0ACC1TDB0_9APHY|nr:hypothetical protein NM688_g924 [Phlebia brevispora]
MLTISSLLLAFLTLAGSTPAPEYVPAPLPAGWWSPVPCSEDDGSRLFENALTTVLANNTPSACIEYCDALQYDFAGVEYSSRCFCGTDFTNDTPQNTIADPSNCYLPCTGDPEYTCGGNWYVQLYERTKPQVTFPPEWDIEMACAIDVPTRIITDDTTFVFANNTPTACMEYCDNQGYTFAGVEYGDECHCGTGVVAEAQESNSTVDCMIPCAGSNHYYCGGYWKMQVYSSVCTPA